MVKLVAAESHASAARSPTSSRRGPIRRADRGPARWPDEAGWSMISSPRPPAQATGMRSG